MDNIATNMEQLYQKAKDYTEISIELFRLNAIDKTADLVSSLLSRFILAMFVTMFTLFVNIALSLYIGKLLEETYLGFLIVSGIYLVLSIVILLYSDKLLKKPLTNLVIAKLLKTKDKRNYPNISENEEA
ncbi:hypothetical protein FLGE108171_05300 [Flavobacterium gelidilacus]|jgi:hypothetical protein|uniref:hypothetical protein n=1 Tax=Flavobacterium gelidilacus TaxID=206041 RepID=UPI0003FD3DE0|nr:hypothetical protein [Flavobacterium gelidilacus]